MIDYIYIYICVYTHTHHEYKYFIFSFVHKTVNCSQFLFHLFRYSSVSTFVNVPEEGVEIVNFTLTRIHSYMNGQMTEDTTPVLDPSLKEFQSLIKQLSGESGLDKLIMDTHTQSSFRYRRYSEVSEFLRGLTLNFPEITSLQRYSPLNASHKVWQVRLVTVSLSDLCRQA